MNASDFANIRLSSQQISSTKFSSAKEIVACMVAMQAQDYPMAKWAIGVRLPGSMEPDIDAAIDKAEIIRTHLLRPTWHFVAAEDIVWLLDLTAPQVQAAQSSRERDLGLTAGVFAKSDAIIQKSLSMGVHLTREELISELQKTGIATDQNRASHLLAHAELEKIICSGISRKGKPTYALLSERVPFYKNLSKDEALAELARRYFISRAPATLQDFTWWSGLSAGNARSALEQVKSDFQPLALGGKTYWLPADFIIPPPKPDSVCLLPTYDEFIISYADRSASIPVSLEQHMRQISDRGVFRPIIVVNGIVTGIWKRTLSKGTVKLELELFDPVDQPSKHAIEAAADRFSRFISRPMQLLYPF